MGKKAAEEKHAKIKRWKKKTNKDDFFKREKKAYMKMNDGGGEDTCTKPGTDSARPCPQHLVTLRKSHCAVEFKLDTRLSSRSVWLSVRADHKKRKGWGWSWGKEEGGK